MKEIQVKVTKPYSVFIGEGIIHLTPNMISGVCVSKRVAIITDDIVDGLYAKSLQDDCQKAGFKVCKYVFPNGEKSKNISILTGILEYLAKNNFRRNDTLIALGGGVVGDIAGLAAALYMRGINVIQIPTTLLAMVDSSVGGKTAVDLENGKNLVGAFWQPVMVICDTQIANDLPDRIFAEGMAEVIKCNVIKDLPIIDYISKDVLEEHLSEVIENCIALKRDVVELDEFDEKGIRNILNVGHTVAHAIEKLSGYSISHGNAVGTGMIIEAKMAYAMGLCNQNTVLSIQRAVENYGLVRELPWSSKEIAEAMKSDKKNRDANIVFELPTKLGFCNEHRLSTDRVSDLLEMI